MTRHRRMSILRRTWWRAESAWLRYERLPSAENHQRAREATARWVLGWRLMREIEPDFRQPIAWNWNWGDQ